MTGTTAGRIRQRVAAPVALVVAGVLAMLGVVGCGSSDSTTGAAASSASASASTSVGLDVRDPWVKAADSGMTAAFATLVNKGTTDLTVVSASSSVSPMELHEMTMENGSMVMKRKEGGFVIKAGASHVLEPGGDHLMLMNLSKPVKAGDDVTITLTFADGSSTQFTAVGKPFTGANESYQPSPGMSMSPKA
jgi:copper(I)-binding protein